MKKNNKKKNNILFGKLFFIFFVIVGFYPLISSEAIRVWSIILSIVFLILTIFRPNSFTFKYFVDSIWNYTWKNNIPNRYGFSFFCCCNTYWIAC
jgi:hypothetical protein